MNFKLNYLQFSLLVLGCGIVVTFYSCGTAKRIPEKRNRVKVANTKSDSVTSDSVSTKTLKTPPASTLISPRDAKSVRMIEEGMASWYGPRFNGQLTADGEVYNMNGMTAAHRTLPFNTLVLVKNTANGKTAVVRITDRGPFAKNRIIDLSKKAAKKLGMLKTGTAYVKLYVAQQAVASQDTSGEDIPTYTIQLGSFKTEARAYRHAKKIKGARVEIVQKNNQFIYRVYYGLYTHRKTARHKQKELEHKDFSCFIKQIDNK